MEKTINKNLKRISRMRFFILNTKYLIQRERSAFTLVELIVVVAISAVISVGGFMTIYKYRAAQNIKLALGEIVAVARNTQQMSVTQKSGKQWGIRFSNSVADGQSFRTWSGSSFASSSPNQTYKLRAGVSFGNPATGKDIDIIFSPISGGVSQNQIITLLAGSAGSTVGDVIVNTLGKVTTRKEEGLVGYWHLDEATSTIAYDMSGYGNNGTLYSSPTWQASGNCKAGGCLSFDGSTNYVRVNNFISQPTGNAPISISAWIKPSLLLSNRVIACFGVDGGPPSAYGIYASGSNAIASFSSSNGQAIGSTVLQTNQWYFITGVYDGTNNKVYVNGLLDGNTVYSLGNLQAGQISIGVWCNYTTGNNFQGPIDEVRIYNRALSATEILQMYNDIK